MKIAIVTPQKNGNYMVDTVLDGVHSLFLESKEIEYHFTRGFPHPFGSDVESHSLDREDFLLFAQSADIIFLGFHFNDFDTKFIEKIDRWERCIFVDGGEPKQNNRLDFLVQKNILNQTHRGPGGVLRDMYDRCALYLKREKPYFKDVIPFPFGIERRYVQPSIKKDIDFVCIFGQDEFPVLRRYVTELLEDFCKKNNFTYVTKKTQNFTQDSRGILGREDFYTTLARAKVGISVGGGGFDTLRFWETLGNNCFLITERIDIFKPPAAELNYSRIFQCNNLFDFAFYFEKVGALLKEGYLQSALEDEYKKILSRHSTKQRIIDVLKEAHRKGIIFKLPSILS